MQTPKGAGFIATVAVFALTIIQLAVATFGGLDQFDGKGFGYRLIAYPVLMLIVPVIWRWRRPDGEMPWSALLWGCRLLLRLIWSGQTWALVLTITGLGAILAVGWELGEWYTFIRRGTELDGAYEDTLSDELLGTLGALVAALIVGRKAKP